MTQRKVANASPPLIHPMSIIRVLWKGRFLLLAIWIVLTVATVLVVRRLPAVYKADSLILVVSQKIPERYVTSTVNAEPQDRVATISQLILSNTRLQLMVDSFGLYRQDRGVLTREAVIAKMRKDITLKLESGLSSTRPDAIRVSYQAPDPKVAADVANALAKLIIDENLISREGHAENTSAFIEDQLSQAKKALDELETKVSRYKMEHNGELPQQESSLNSSLSRLQVELQGNQEALNRGQQNKVLLENTLSLAESSLANLERTARETVENANRRPATSPAESSAPSPARVKTRYETLRDALAALQMRYGDNHPDVRRAKSELARTQKDESPVPKQQASPSSSSLADAPVAALPASLTDAMEHEKERIGSIRLQLTLLTKELERQEADRTRILQETQSYQSRISRLPYREQEVAGLTRDYDIAKSNYRSLQEKKLSAGMATEMEERQQGEKFTLIDAAHVPERPFKPNRLMFDAIGSLVSLGLGAVIILFRHFQKDTLLGEWEFPAGVVIMGRVPPIVQPKKNLTLSAGGSWRALKVGNE